MSSRRVTHLAQAMGDESVIIYVGPERKRYLVHKALLTKESNYFDRALNGSFKEAEDQAIDLPEESPAAVDLLVGWLYQDRIPVVGSAAGPFLPQLNTSTATEKRGSGFGPGPFHFPSIAPFQSHTSTVSGGLFGTQQHFPVQVEMQNTIFPELNNGTSVTAFRPHTETPSIHPPGTNAAGPWNDTFQSIVAQPAYRNWSTEELRLADYRAGLFDSTHIISRIASTSTNIRSTPPSSPSSSEPFKNTPATIFGTSTRIPGIPTCPSLDDLSIKEEEHQIAVLQLCLLAETFCWDTLFNRAMTAYIAGEANLSHRAMRADHLELIYQRAHDLSPCRAYASDSVIFHLRDGNTRSQYLELTKEYPSFLEDIFKAITKNAGATMKDPTKTPKCGYHNHPDGKMCPKTFYGIPSAQKRMKPTGFGGEAQHTRSWMEYREPTHPGVFPGHRFEGNDEDDD